MWFSWGIIPFPRNANMAKRRKYIIGILTVILLSVIGYILYVKIQGNFHAITPAEAYRSGQLDNHKLAEYVKQYNIRSILNLRGKHSGESWYEEEVATCAKLDVTHYDVSLSSDHELTEAEVGQLLDIFSTAPRPILIHCQAGADRSGLVAAMWKVVVDKEPKDVAAQQLSLRYGHFPVGETHAMDRFFEKWSP
jgi:undecaprenyl-diphosphatase